MANGYCIGQYRYKDFCITKSAIGHFETANVYVSVWYNLEYMVLLDNPEHSRNNCNVLSVGFRLEVMFLNFSYWENNPCFY